MQMERHSAANWAETKAVRRGPRRVARSDLQTADQLECRSVGSSVLQKADVWAARLDWHWAGCLVVLTAGQKAPQTAGRLDDWKAVH